MLAVVVLVSGVAVWVTSPRFAIETPSLVDDWAAIARPSDQLFDVLRLTNPEEERFRPGWIAWTYLQWHTLDAPRGDVGPNVWNVLRMAVLVAGLTLFTALALPPPRRRSQAVLRAALAGIPALLVVTVPKFAVDLARFGPQEPLLIGGMVLGGSLLVLAGRRVLDGTQPVPALQTAALGIGGSAFWVLGAYQKETSLAAIPLIAAVLIVGRTRLAGWTRLSGARRVALAALGAVVTLPLLHVAIESIRITARGDLVYDAEVDRGQGVVRGLGELYDWAHEVLPWTARAIVIAAFVLVALAAAFRRTIDVIALGALASGALTLVLAAQSGTVATRYYMPAYALFGVALALSLARLPRLIQAAGLLALVLVFMPPPGTRDEVRRWVEVEEGEGAVVRTVADLEGSGCVVAAAGLDFETSLALPLLVDIERPRTPLTCTGDTYFVVGPRDEGVALISACAPRSFVAVLQAGEAFTLYRCGRLRSGRVRDPSLGLVEPKQLVAERRLRPASP